MSLMRDLALAAPALRPSARLTASKKIGIARGEFGMETWMKLLRFRLCDQCASLAAQKTRIKTIKQVRMGKALTACRQFLPGINHASSLRAQKRFEVRKLRD